MHFHYHGTEYSVTLEASTAVAVRCEGCGQKYYYRLDCTAAGRCDAPGNYFAKGAQKRAWQIARRRIRRMLESEILAVPCPHCGQYQEEMAALLCKQRYGWTRDLGVVGGFLGLGGLIGPLFILFIESQKPPQTLAPEAGYVLSACGALVFLASVGLLLFRRHKYATFDPNDQESEQERVALGRRLAITREQAKALMETSGEPRYVPPAAHRAVFAFYGYVGVNYSASASGTTIARVACERCGKTYYYQLARTVHARIHSPFDIGGKAAPQRANDRARERLRQMLEADTDAVPCPHCGTYQEAMLPVLRNPRLKRLRYLGITGLVLAGAAGLVSLVLTAAAANLNNRSELGALMIAWGITALTLLGGVLVLLVRRHKNATYDPNDPKTEAQRIELGRQSTITREQAEALMEQ
jgi:hypothetical protein